MTAFINNVNGMACVWVHVVVSMQCQKKNMHNIYASMKIMFEQPFKKKYSLMCVFSRVYLNGRGKIYSNLLFKYFN